MKRESVSSPVGLKIARDGEFIWKFMRLLMFGTVMLMANSVGAQNSIKPFHLDEATISSPVLRGPACSSSGRQQATLTARPVNPS